MELWRITQDTNNGYDTYSDAIVAAETEELAKHTHPSNYLWLDGKWKHERADGSYMEEGHYGTWADPQLVSVEHIGEAKDGTEAGVICASFHAG